MACNTTSVCLFICSIVYLLYQVNYFEICLVSIIFWHIDQDRNMVYTKEPCPWKSHWHYFSNQVKGIDYKTSHVDHVVYKKAYDVCAWNSKRPQLFSFCFLVLWIQRENITSLWHMLLSNMSQAAARAYVRLFHHDRLSLFSVWHLLLTSRDVKLFHVWTLEIFCHNSHFWKVLRIILLGFV